MIFDDENKVIIDSMNYDEAVAFLKFLKSEILRHYTDIHQAQALMSKVQEQFGVYENA